MSLNDVVLPQKYKNGQVLFQQQLDAWRIAAEQAFNTVNLNFTQLQKDLFLATYQYTNNGNPQLSQSLQEQINLLASGGTPITGTTSATWTINSAGNSVVLTSVGLTAIRTYGFPDVSDTLVTLMASQVLTNKSLTAPILTNPSITGVGAGVGILQYANNALSTTYILPQSLLPTPTITLQDSPWLTPPGHTFDWDDFGILPTPDPLYFQICNGAPIVFGVLNGQNTKDFSGRYAVGYGTDGGGNIGTDPYNATPVGNAGNTINIQHAHNTNSQNNTTTGDSNSPTTTGASSSTTSDVTATLASTGNSGRGTSADPLIFNGSALFLPSGGGGQNGVSGTTDPHHHTMPHTHDNHHGHDYIHMHGTDSQLSTTQSIQPISIRMRKYVRVA